jgi:ER membrane protein complex subunit 1, C-terminal
MEEYEEIAEQLQPSLHKYSSSILLNVAHQQPDITTTLISFKLSKIPYLFGPDLCEDTSASLNKLNSSRSTMKQPTKTITIQSASLSFIWLLLATVSSALFADEVGVSDFLVATAGHGPAKFVYATEEAVISSDSPGMGHYLTAFAPKTSCFVASRSTETGSLQWRRNVCSSTSSGSVHHAVAASQESIWTMDSSGVIRAWDTKYGRLIWDAFLELQNGATDQPRLLVVTDSTVSRNGIGAVAGDQMLLLDAVTGEPLGKPLSASNILADNRVGGAAARSGQQAHWLQMMTDEKDKWQVLLGWISHRDGIVSTAGSDMLLVDLEWQQGEGIVTVTKSERLSHIPQIDASSLHVMPEGVGVALTADGTKAVTFGVPHSTIESFKVTAVPEIDTLSSLSLSVARLQDNNGDEHVNTHKGVVEIPSWTSPIAFSSCAGTAHVVVVIPPGQSNMHLWKDRGETGSSWKSVTLEPGREEPANALRAPTVTGLGCRDHLFDVLLSTSSGTTAAVQINLSSGEAIWKWSAEEGLGHIASGLVLDASHAIVVDDLVVEGDSEEEPPEIAQRLQLSARMTSQWESLMGSGVNLITARSASKDKLFGFVQIAVLVSERTHRLYGMELAGPKRGTVSWTVDLTTGAMWHKLVHGTHNAAKAKHGIHGGTHAKEVLVVSASTQTRVDYKCVDGTNGEVHGEGSMDISSPVVQVIPVVGGGVCRQQAVLMHEDHSISLVPAESSISHTFGASSANGFYAHVLTGPESAFVRLESYQISAAAASARLVGQTTFEGERLIQAVYPPRDEVVQSPCMVLGDDSLLLKYLNPHLAAIISVRDVTAGDGGDEFGAALRRSKQQNEKKKKKKPVGVTPKPGSKAESATADDGASDREDTANFFVSLVDTVSGRVLYRASHANASTNPRHIKAVISENWIVYSFVNAKTRKTEVGVLSLYEGMIHRKGLTAFTSPEQTTEFSSWDARETKPIVLSKTYSIPQPVTALGVTQTRNGISAHQILLATTENRVYSVARAVLEPRRPLSDLKESEKLEGLRQYSELIPLLTMQALSYNLTVHAPTQIVSAPTELESQTLVFAFGGPDLFFTRTSPSKGFDMLPESFNRILLSLLTVALVAVVVVTKRMSKQKIVKHGWI